MEKDALGRRHQVATIQLDFVQPSRFELFCINEKGEKEPVVMLHVAIMGSIERFLSVIIEHFAGAFPLWMSPVQLRIVPIGERQQAFAEEVYKKAKTLGIRVELDDSKDSFGKRVRNAKTEKVPVVAVIGDKEMESGELTLEGRTEKIGVLKADEALEMILEKIKNKSLHI
jgi:threonyl-tRNA synthetase